jgi:hypothetical protein
MQEKIPAEPTTRKNQKMSLHVQIVPADACRTACARTVDFMTVAK